MPESKVIPVVMQKGGVGKSSIVVNLATVMANMLEESEQEHPILVVDMDPQATATGFFWSEYLPAEKTIASLFDPDTPFHVWQESLIVPTRFNGIQLLPSHMSLSIAEAFDYPEGITRLKDFIYLIVPWYTIVLIDCPTSLGKLTLNALATATDVLVPLMPEQPSIDAMAPFSNVLDHVSETVNPDAKLMGVVVNSYDGRIRSHKVGREKIIRMTGDFYLGDIHRTSEIPEIWMTRQPITKSNKAARPYREYRALAQKVLERIGYGKEIRTRDNA